MSLISVQHLSHRFSNGSFGIEDINLTIQAGEFVVFAGANGAGKTTFFKHLNGLLIPTTGRVIIDGICVSDHPKKARQLVGMVFQDADTQIVGETVWEDIAFGPENLCLDRSEINKRVHQALVDVQLMNVAHQRPHVLSGGEKRRLAIAGILAMGSKILIFDEPFSNLDYPGYCQVMRQIISLHQSKHTILLSTHDLDKVISYADRLIIMNKGKIVKDGRPDSLINCVGEFGIKPPCQCSIERTLENSFTYN